MAERSWIRRHSLVVGVAIGCLVLSTYLHIQGDGDRVTSNGIDKNREHEAGPIPYAVQHGDTYFSVAERRLEGTAAEGSQRLAQCYADEARRINDGLSVRDLGTLEGVQLMRLPLLSVRSEDGTTKLVYWEFDENGNPVSTNETLCAASNQR